MIAGSTSGHFWTCCQAFCDVMHPDPRRSSQVHEKERDVFFLFDATFSMDRLKSVKLVG